MQVTDAFSLGICPKFINTNTVQKVSHSEHGFTIIVLDVPITFTELHLNYELPGGVVAVGGDWAGVAMAARTILPGVKSFTSGGNQPFLVLDHN